jgi:hypothetical protein
MILVHDDAYSRWSWFAVVFHKKELIPGVQGANCQVLNSSHDIHKDSASSWSAAARRAWFLCERERGFCGLASLVQLIPDDDAKCSTYNFEFCLRTFVSQWCDPREIVAASYGWRQPRASESGAAQSWWSLLASPRKCYSSVKSSVCSCCWEFCGI